PSAVAAINLPIIPAPVFIKQYRRNRPSLGQPKRPTSSAVDAISPISSKRCAAATRRLRWVGIINVNFRLIMRPDADVATFGAQASEFSSAGALLGGLPESPALRRTTAAL